MKISIYKFITAFCLFPVSDWGAFVQRLTKKLLTIWLVSRLIDVIKAPLFYIGLIGILIYSPDTVAWIFIKIGEIELSVMTLMLSVVMPDIFSGSGTEYTTWAQMWQAGLNALPSDMVEIINGLGVAQLLGYITTTIGTIATIKMFRSAMKRARLM